jgi:hypothetical protein
MIDVNSLDTIFVDDVMYLFDRGESINKIAYTMGCDMETIDAIVCRGISMDTRNYLDLLS